MPNEPDEAKRSDMDSDKMDLVSWMRETALPFWVMNGWDEARGGFVEELTQRVAPRIAPSSASGCRVDSSIPSPSPRSSVGTPTPPPSPRRGTPTSKGIVDRGMGVGIVAWVATVRPRR
jgi:hypothetical protein